MGEMMENNGWTGIPSTTLVRMFPNIKDHIVMLKDEFGVETDLHTIYTSYAYEVETSIAELVKDLLTSPPIFIPSEISFTRNDLSQEQKDAVSMALNKNISVITGSGGSGKSSVIKEIVHNLEKNGIPYRVASFTGKAVARIREITEKKEPATLHMMIATNKSNKEKKSSFSCLILDESSMITTQLLYEFRKQFPHKFKIIFVGDNNQLQPIGWGSLFEALIKTNIVPVTTL